jgi:putative pyruvate formate lyase activating enzyme
MKNLCNICPRNCNVDREEKLGVCKASNKVKISKVMLHFFEEPPISGFDTANSKANGSGTIFFANCNLKCIFCQNCDISSGGYGKEIEVQTLADIFKQLEDAGANNINLVSPTHYTNQIIEALNIYKPRIPIVWNTSGYEKSETIKKLENHVDIYLTDFKYFDSSLSQKLSNAINYPENCKQSILQMRKNVPEDVFENGLMKKGIIIRHLVLPNQTNDSKNIIDWIYENLGNKTYISLMSQYVPMFKAKDIPEINRKISPLEYKILVSYLNKLKFKNVFLQHFSSASDIYTPDFLTKTDDFKY